MTLPQHLTERRMQVNRTAIRRYADLTLDYNPIHLDPVAAAQSPMGGIVAHGMLSLSLVWQSLAATFGHDRMAGVELAIRFIRPVRENDWVVAGGSRTDDWNYDIWVKAEKSDRTETVIAGSVTLNARMPKA